MGAWKAAAPIDAHRACDMAMVELRYADSTLLAACIDCLRFRGCALRAYPGYACGAIHFAGAAASTGFAFFTY